MSGRAQDGSVLEPSTARLPAPEAEAEPIPLPLHYAERLEPPASTADLADEAEPERARIVPRPPVQPAPVLRSKVQPPPLRTSTLSRQRLLDKLARATESRVTLVVADAGFGKSTLLSDFSRRFDGVCLWYSLEEDDIDWLTLVPHLVAAAREVRPDFGALTTSLLRAEPGMAPPKSAVVSGLLSELETLHEGRVVVIFDDAHAIEDSPDANELIGRLVRQAPASFSFILAGRRRPAVPLARWAGKGELVELTTDDLRFTRDETGRLFADSYGQTIEPDVLDEVDARTQGWAACLQLFSTLVSGLSPVAIRTAARSLTGTTTAVFEYLAQEVVASLAPDLQTFLTRASLLQVIAPEYLQALFVDVPAKDVRQWATEADRLGLLSRATPTSGERHFHPLLRDYLLAELGRRHSPAEIRDFHAAVARAAESDPLTACHHYIEAGLPDEAMRSLSSSTLQTLGSGLAGTAAVLASRLGGQPPSGAVAAMRARRLLEEGDVAGAAAVLGSVKTNSESPSVRAALRQTSVNLAWRSGDADGLLATVEAILLDPETPELLRDIAQVMRDESTGHGRHVTRAALAQRLCRMAEKQEAVGYDYYAAISLHNAAIAYMYAGRLREALDVGSRALDKFSRLAVRSPEFHSCHAVLTHVNYELGQSAAAEQHISEALAGETDADVPAEFAFLRAIIGDRHGASRHLEAAEAIERSGRSDLSARVATVLAIAFLQLPARPADALRSLALAPGEFPLGFETDELAAMGALAHLLNGDEAAAARTAAAGYTRAHERGSRLCEVRLKLVLELASEHTSGIAEAVVDAAQVSELALLETADALGPRLHLLRGVMSIVDASVGRWPGRWLPVLRKQLELGNDPRAHIAAELLDRHGTLDDISRLRAFDRTYRRKAVTSALGRELVRRVSPRVTIHDLGQVAFSVGDRLVKLSRMRRRSGALLMYLVTRPNFTATREQVIEDLWPDGDLGSGTNSLNQSLYFLRRDIDPWYEADVSAEYVTLEAELVSLDPELVRSESTEFVAKTRQTMAAGSAPELLGLVDSYRGQFAPEFEYEEWALSWRARVHAAYLNFARTSIDHLARVGDLRTACDIALLASAIDPGASDIERALIWLYWRMGATSAAETQYLHWASSQRADGMDPVSLSALVGSVSPP